jgi:hypothetical protein
VRARALLLPRTQLCGGIVFPARKLLLSIAVLGSAASIAGLGTFATFTSSDEHEPHDRERNALADNPVQPSRAQARARSPGRHDAARDRPQLLRHDLLRLGTLTTSARARPCSTPTPTNGLQIAIDKCSQAWTESGPPYTYTCGGSTSTVLASRALIGSAIALRT